MSYGYPRYQYDGQPPARAVPFPAAALAPPRLSAAALRRSQSPGQALALGPVSGGRRRKATRFSLTGERNRAPGISQFVVPGAGPASQQVKFGTGSAWRQYYAGKQAPAAPKKQYKRSVCTSIADPNQCVAAGCAYDPQSRRFSKCWGRPNLASSKGSPRCRRKYPQGTCETTPGCEWVTVSKGAQAGNQFCRVASLKPLYGAAGFGPSACSVRDQATCGTDPTCFWGGATSWRDPSCRTRAGHYVPAGHSPASVLAQLAPPAAAATYYDGQGGEDMGYGGDSDMDMGYTRNYRRRRAATIY